MKNFKTPFLSALVFFGTLLVLSVGYAAWTMLDPTDADGGKPLTSTLLKSMINSINDIGTRTDGIYSVGGNIGIGTASPGTAKINIVGQTADSSSYGLIVQNNSGSPLIYARNDGNIGIGTTNPGVKLDINGNVHVSGDIYSTGWTLLTPSSYYAGSVYYKIIGKHVVFRGFLNSTLSGRAAGWFYLFSNWPVELAAGRGISIILHGWNGTGLIRDVYGVVPGSTCTGGSCFQIFKAYTDGDPTTQGEYILFDTFSYELL